MKIIALDWGQKRIGVAIGDTETRLALPRNFILSDNSALQKIKSLYESEGAEKIILGFPRKLDGTEGESADKVRDFADKLRDTLGCEVELIDERFTTVLAQSMIHAGSQAKQKRQHSLRNEVDSLSALELLQGYFSQK